MLQLVSSSLLVYFGDKNVETAHAYMTIATEVKVAIGTEGREHLVARCVDGFTEILYTAKTGSRKTDTPNVKAAYTSRHV